MANLPETATYDAGVYQLETTDPVIGGADGKDNASARNLANRTAYLKAHVDLMETIVSQADAEEGISTTLKGWNALRVRQAIMAATGGYLSKSVAGGSNVTLTAAEANNGIIRLTGALTASINVIVPIAPTRSWIIINATSGAYTVTIKTPTGSGVVCTQGYKAVVWTDGANVADALTDFDNVVLTGSPVAPTPAQFANDTAIATTEFIKQAMGNFSNATAFVFSSNVPVTAAGSWAYFNANSITLNLPLLSACPEGTAIYFSANAKTGAVVGIQSSDTIVAGSQTVTSVSLSPHDTALFINKTGAWYLLAGEARLPFSSSFANSITTDGYYKLPNGLIMQWGRVNTSSSADTAITFPIAFPSYIYNLTFGGTTGSSVGVFSSGKDITLSGFNLNSWTATSTRAGISTYWHALGK